MVGGDIGLIGLGVMGQNLARNIQNHGYSVAVYNRTGDKTRAFVGKYPGFLSEYSLEKFVIQLNQPRRIFLMVTAGTPVDATLTSLTGFLSSGDVLIDGGNSFFQDTERRCTDHGKARDPLPRRWCQRRRRRGSERSLHYGRRAAGRVRFSS